MGPLSELANGDNHRREPVTRQRGDSLLRSLEKS
jgi:hypothetical protein